MELKFFYVFNQLDKWRRKETTDRHISPLGLMCLQGEEMKKETKIDVKIL
jgi:hypothetical protein